MGGSPQLQPGLELDALGRRHRDERTAPVGRVLAPLDEPAPVELAHHQARRCQSHAQALGELADAELTVHDELDQHGDVARAEARVVARTAGQPRNGAAARFVGGGAAEQRRPAALEAANEEWQQPHQLAQVALE